MAASPIRSFKFIPHIVPPLISVVVKQNANNPAANNPIWLNAPSSDGTFILFPKDDPIASCTTNDALPDSVSGSWLSGLETIVIVSSLSLGMSIGGYKIGSINTILVIIGSSKSTILAPSPTAYTIFRYSRLCLSVQHIVPSAIFNLIWSYIKFCALNPDPWPYVTNGLSHPGITHITPRTSLFVSGNMYTFIKLHTSPSNTVNVLSGFCFLIII